MQLGKLAKFTILETYPPGMEVRRIADIIGWRCAAGSGPSGQGGGGLEGHRAPPSADSGLVCPPGNVETELLTMSFQERFTQSEQELLATTPILIGSTMAFAESSGLGTVKELFASANTYISGLKTYPNNEIIQGILPDLDDREQAREQAKAVREHAIARLKEKGIDSTEKIRALLLDDSRAVASLLSEKASAEEAEQYREWAMAVAENVAKAAHEGGFLGFGGTQVSEGERALFRELADALGSQAQLS